MNTCRRVSGRVHTWVLDHDLVLPRLHDPDLHPDVAAGWQHLHHRRRLVAFVPGDRRLVVRLVVLRVRAIPSAPARLFDKNHWRPVRFRPSSTPS